MKISTKLDFPKKREIFIFWKIVKNPMFQKFKENLLTRKYEISIFPANYPAKISISFKNARKKKFFLIK